MHLYKYKKVLSIEYKVLSTKRIRDIESSRHRDWDNQ